MTADVSVGNKDGGQDGVSAQSTQSTSHCNRGALPSKAEQAHRRPACQLTEKAAHTRHFGLWNGVGSSMDQGT